VFAAKVVRVTLPTTDWLELAATVTALVAQAAAVALQMPTIVPSMTGFGGNVKVCAVLAALISNTPPLAIPAVFTVPETVPIVNDAGKAVK